MNLPPCCPAFSETPWYGEMHDNEMMLACWSCEHRVKLREIGLCSDCVERLRES